MTILKYILFAVAIFMFLDGLYMGLLRYRCARKLRTLCPMSAIEAHVVRIDTLEHNSSPVYQIVYAYEDSKGRNRNACSYIAFERKPMCLPGDPRYINVSMDGDTAVETNEVTRLIQQCCIEAGMCLCAFIVVLIIYWKLILS